MKVRLTATDACAAQRELFLVNLPITLGRSEEADVTLDDRWVSRQHCIISEADDGRLMVRDLESKHGTLVNGRRITSSPLVEGDRLSIGISSYIVSFQDAPSQAVRP